MTRSNDITVCAGPADTTGGRLRRATVIVTKSDALAPAGVAAVNANTSDPGISGAMKPARMLSAPSSSTVRPLICFHSMEKRSPPASTDPSSSTASPANTVRSSPASTTGGVSTGSRGQPMRPAIATKVHADLTVKIVYQLSLERQPIDPRLEGGYGAES